MAIITKSIYQPKDADDGLRILITRFYPRGIKRDHFDLWIKELSPSIDLLLGYKEGKYSWDVFKQIFLYEIANNIDSLEILCTLHEQSTTLDITFLCFERDGNPCHRHLVKEITESPRLLNDFFEPEDTNYHEGRSMKILISN